MPESNENLPLEKLNANYIPIHINTFEGPMGVLFALIEKNKIDIYDIPIAVLTDQYLAYIEEYTYRDMEQMSDFLLMAATLLEIKSKMLLPKPATPEEEEADPRDVLVNKLVAYKQCRALASYLQENELGTLFFYRPAEENTLQMAAKPDAPGENDISDILGDISLSQLMQVFQEVLNRRELKTDKIRGSFNAVSKDLFTVEDKISHFQNLLVLHNNIRFTALFPAHAPKMEKVVSFLAMLELIKRKEIQIQQGHLFGDIIITRYSPKL